MKRLFAIALTALTLAACSTNNDVSTFYRQNPAAAAGRRTKTSAAFVLAEPATVRSTTQSYMGNGYRLLGVSEFSNLLGQPMRTQALAYAKQIGADLVVYAVAPIGPELHPVNHLVMDSPGGYVTTNTITNVSGNFDLNGDVNGFGNYDGSGTATTTTYVPPQFHTQVVPETFIRTQHAIAFLAD
jgi:hypothetical protein